MGNCCVSSATEEHKDSVQRALPPTHPLPEEETVKEVLSETTSVPKLQPHILSNGSHQPKNSSLEEEMKRPNKPSAVMVFNSDEFFTPEIYGTRGERVFTTAATTDKRDRENDIVEARVRSPARVQKRSFPDGRSPSRRFEQSPGRVRSGSGRDTGHGSPCNALRRENGESSGLRSRSPSMQAENGNARTGLGRSLSARKTGKALDWIRSELGDKNRMLDESFGSTPSTACREKWAPTNSNESLENPLVSLECFIFL